MTPEQEQLATALVSLILGGGLFSGVASLIKSLGERRQLKALAAEKNIKTPAELGGILASGAGDLVTMAMAMAQEAKTDAAAAKAEAKAATAENEALRGRVEGLESSMGAMRRANEAVQRYVAKLIAYIEALGHVPPEPDEEYRLQNTPEHEA